MVKIISVIWLSLSVLYAGLLIQYQRVTISNELVAHTNSVASSVSQRADQHDAHLTGLAAVALAGERPDASLFMEVVAAIEQFYPRVTSVDLVSLANEDTVISSRQGQSNNELLHNIMREAAKRSAGSLELAVSPRNDNRYLIVKRVPNSDAARYALALEIDATQLVAVESSSWDKISALSLSMPNGTLLSRQDGNNLTTTTRWFNPLVVENVLQSRTQPLKLETVVHLGASTLLPFGALLIGIIILGLSLIILATIIRLFRKSRRAELRARLGEQDAKISHASRVNSLGELSSGIAHELTQPLTAILSQSQAGMRLLKQSDNQHHILSDVLSANVVQAKRASDILARLREWTKQTNESSMPIDINVCVQNVLFLIDAEIKKHAIQLDIQLSPHELLVMGDSVEIEQVIFNLIQNALDKRDANDGAPNTIELTTANVDSRVIVSVKDDGFPIDDGMLDRIFEPFVSSKQDGMGLGLALCERIVNRLDGHIELSNETTGVKASFSLPAI